MYTDSKLIQERIKEMGGRVDDIALRCSIEWNYGCLLDNNDYDLWCREPQHFKIMYDSKESEDTGGWLDIDVTRPSEYYKSSVENIIYPYKHKMSVGDYTFVCHNYEDRGGDGGFRGEIAIGDDVYEFDYPHELGFNEQVRIGVVNYDGSRLVLKKMYI